MVRRIHQCAGTFLHLPSLLSLSVCSYQMMLSCWELDPADRPTAAELVEKLLEGLPFSNEELNAESMDSSQSHNSSVDMSGLSRDFASMDHTSHAITHVDMHC